MTYHARDGYNVHFRNKIKTPPTTFPVTLPEVKEHLRLDFDDDDGYLQTLIEVATVAIDGPNGWLGRALEQQTWGLELPAFTYPVRIPAPKLQTIDVVQYLDEAGAPQTMDANDYQIVGLGGEHVCEMRPRYGQTWPSTYPEAQAVQITFTCGYPQAGSPLTSTVPAPIRHALLMMIADMYCARETFVVGTNAMPIPMSMTVAALLAPWQVGYAP